MMKKAFLTASEIKHLQEAELASQKPQKRTPEQIEAIYTQGHNILVSASAGSGKTFVMVERILDKLLRGVGIKNLFISTFTVKAATELKERLESKLKEALATSNDDQERQHLSQQIIDLQTADIGTMDAFTQKLVAEYGYLLGISPQFKILTDKSEQDFLQEEIYQELFSDYMAGQDRQIFEDLVTNFSVGRKDSKLFKNVVYKIYDFIQSTPNPRQWLLETFLKASRQEMSLSDLPDYMVADFLDSLWETATALEDLTLLPDYKQVTTKGEPTANYKKHLAIIVRLREVAKDFQLLYGKERISKLALQLSQDLPKGKDVTVAGVKYPVFKTLQDSLLAIKHLETIISYQGQSQPLLELLQSFMLDFQSRYLERKKAENAFEFADISHLAIAILENYPDVRQDFQDRYHEVMVDEYQDTNHTQEAMLDLLSNGHNRFMVGDIKQSIYRFRQSDPQLFNQKFNLYQEDRTQGQLILLKENFRSQTEILTVTNAIFSRLMDERLGDLVYDSKHQLVAGSEGQNLVNLANQTEYLVYDTDQPDSDEELASEISKGEVDLLVKEIIRLHQEEKVPFKDITLLVSSRSRNDAILTIFEQHGIPLVTDGGEQNYLKSLEIMVMLDTLRTINNPNQDYPLVALLKSPMFQFNEDDLARLALQAKAISFYDKLKLALSGQGAEPDLIKPDLVSKLTYFVTTLSSWRQFAKLHSLYDLIWKIYQDRLYYDYVGAMPNGQKRQANLYALALRADSFEKTGFKGLSRFIRMIDRVLDSQNDLADVELALPKDAVQLMTIHKSKGLQFKYVFVLNMDKTFDKRDDRDSVILSRENGIGIRYLADMKQEFDTKTSLPHVHVLMDTLPYQLNQRELKLAGLSEQMRLLYVAMTRAEKKLYLVGKGSREKLENKFPQESEDGRLPFKVRESMSSFQDWFFGILTAFPKTDLGFKLTYVTDRDLTAEKLGKLEVKLPLEVDNLSANRQSEQIVRALDMMESVDKLNHRYAKAIKLPTVRTPSQIKAYYEPVMDSEGVDVIVKKPLEATFKLPDFTAKAKVTPLALGSAIHELMQRLPFDRPISPALIQETLADVNAQDHVKAQLDLMKIQSFFETELGQSLQSQVSHLHREAPFAILHKDKETGEDYVIRGIIDGYLLLKDKIVLFDYKTDRYQSILEIKERYRGQMSLYAQALRQSYGIEKVESYLVLLGGEKVEVVSYDR